MKACGTDECGEKGSKDDTGHIEMENYMFQYNSNIENANQHGASHEASDKSYQSKTGNQEQQDQDAQYITDQAVKKHGILQAQSVQDAAKGGLNIKERTKNAQRR